MLLKILWRNAFRHRLRTALTLGGILVAILAFGLLRTVIDAWYAGVAQSSAARLVTRNAVSLIFPLPLYYREKIRQVDNVTLVSYGNWFGAYYIERKNFFANFAVAAESYMKLYPEFVLSDEQKMAFLRDRQGAVVGRKLAERFGWRLGQGVVLHGTIFPGDWQFVVRAIYRGRDPTVDETLFIFHWDYLNETLKKTQPSRADEVGYYMEGIKRPEFAARTAAAIDVQFENSAAETLTETEKAFQLGFIAMSGAIIAVIQIVSVVIIVILLAVVANTMAMAVRERLGEYAVFKTLGLSQGFIAGLIFGESLVITTLGGLLGIALTFPAARAFAAALSEFFPVFRVAPATLVWQLAAALVVGVLAAMFPARLALRVPIAQAMGRIG